MPRAAYRHVLIIGIWADRQRASGRNDRLFLFLSFGRDLRLDLRGTSTTSDLEFAPPQGMLLFGSRKFRWDYEPWASMLVASVLILLCSQWVPALMAAEIASISVGCAPSTGRMTSRCTWVRT